MLEFIETGELTFLGFLTFVGLMMIIFPKDMKVLIGGTFILSMLMVIAYTHHRHHFDKEFILKRFNEGHAIECGLWRGERTLINTKSGWIYQSSIGFIKEDRIHNDLGWCNVIGQKAPEPSVVPYTFALIIELIVCFALRGAVQNVLKKEEEKENTNEPDPQ
ncbi:MAG TPA: hypothetical protein PLM93_11520 [Sulfuricurvum sp.]|nr:MAG: hypothetical protein B7Y30_06815 [Campylobacterales bacterium 16-40-21]OZA02211.1 MAG: hypothetical protein B7X89_10280 [Sulfuricurvum sp. 17-40-25]HQS67803.1 hypothetical protein [Sulfuricurvum sp.]HQT36300.1 hypothetical protein [Sulfuricurvum sp.]